MGACLGLFLIPIAYLTIVGFISGQLAGRGISHVVLQKFKNYKAGDVFAVDFGWAIAAAVGAAASSTLLCVSILFIEWKILLRNEPLSWTISIFVAAFLFGAFAAFIGWRIMNFQIKNIEGQEGEAKMFEG